MAKSILIKLPLLVSQNANAHIAIAIYPCVIFTDAEKKHHEYLVWLVKPPSEEAQTCSKQKQQKYTETAKGLYFIITTNKVLYICFLLFERRVKYAMRIEIKVMQSLNKKFMSDEDTDPEDDTTFKRSPSWQCESSIL